MLDSQLPGSFLWTSAIFFLMTVVFSSDPCPPESTLSPCWCTDFPPYWIKTTESGTSTPEYSSSYQPTSTTFPGWWTAATSTPINTSPSGWWWTTTEVATRKRRHAKRQIDSFSAFSRAAYYTVVSCNFTSSVHVLEDAIGKGLAKRWVDKVVISNHRFDSADLQVRLPNRLFQNTRMKQVEFTQTQLAGDFINSGEPFVGQEHSLMWFTVNSCFLRGQLTYSDDGTVQTMGLNKLTRLQGLDFSYNELEYIRDSAFRYPPANLHTLKISSNKIKKLDIYAFQKIPKLRVLDLSHNLLDTLRKTMFPTNGTNLRYMDFSWNYLTTLPNDFFANMPALRTFNISHNYIHTLPSNTWAPVWKQFHHFDITGNYLSCDCSLMWLPPILWGSGGNGTSTASPTSLQGHTILGSCSAFQPDSYPEHYPLSNLTRSNLDC